MPSPPPPPKSFGYGTTQRNYEIEFSESSPPVQPPPPPPPRPLDTLDALLCKSLGTCSIGTRMTKSIGSLGLETIDGQTSPCGALAKHAEQIGSPMYGGRNPCGAQMEQIRSPMFHLQKFITIPTVRKIPECEIRPRDVLLGRGRPLQKHPGNIRMRELVADRFDEYDASEKQKRTEISENIVRKIGDYGGRFLEQVKDPSTQNSNDSTQTEKRLWIEIDFLTARKKVAFTFRTIRKARKKKESSISDEEKVDDLNIVTKKRKTGQKTFLTINSSVEQGLVDLVVLTHTKVGHDSRAERSNLAVTA